MKKVGLLFFALASCCAGAFAGDAYYLIKDGKLQNGVELDSYNNDTKADGNLTEGSEYATIVHNGNYEMAFETRLAVPEGLRLKTKSIILEYMSDPLDIRTPENSGSDEKVATAEKPDKATIIIQCLSKEHGGFVGGGGLGESVMETDENGNEVIAYPAANLISRTFIDAKTPGCEKDWQTFKEYTYPFNDKDVRTVIIGYKREVTGASLSKFKIKNLYFETEEDTYPIYGCQFDGDNIFSDSDKLANISDELHFPFGIYMQWDKDNKQVNANAQILQQWDKSDDGTSWSDESGIPMCQMYSALAIYSPVFKPKVGVYSIWTDNIALPEEAIAAGKIKVECYVKKWAKDNMYELVGNVDGINQDELIPITVKFDNGDSVVAYKDSIIYGMWKKEVAEIAIPNGAKSIVIDFKQNPNVSYVVDKLLISYKGKVGVATIDGDSKTLSVYPNPVSEAIEFAGIEDIQSVEIASLNGAVKSYAVVNGKVNVSSLAAGEYIIIVNKSITGKFIKK